MNSLNVWLCLFLVGHAPCVSGPATACSDTPTRGMRLLGVPRCSDESDLHAACRSGSVVEVERLLREGADPNRRCGGIAALHVAAQGVYLPILRALLQHGAQVDIRATDEDGRSADTPLHVAVRAESIEAARCLLDHGADPNSRTENGLSPVFLARDRQLLALLVAHSADLEARSVFGETPVESAASFGEFEKAEYLLSSGASYSFRTAVYLGDLQRVRECVAQRPHLVASLRDHFGRTPLHWASAAGHAHIVEWLLAHGADVNELSLSAGGRAAVSALSIGTTYPAVVAVLLREGANPNAPVGPFGRSALHTAVCAQNAESIKLLLLYGADPLTKDELQLTPVDLARDQPNPHLLRILDRCRPLEHRRP